MKNDLLEERIAELARRLDRLEMRLASLEGHARRPAMQKAPVRRASQPRPPWRLDAAGIEALVDAMYERAVKGPQEALAFERPAGRDYLAAHSRNVARLAMFIAARHGFSEASIRTIGICGLLHDAGMQGTGAGIISSARPLTDEDYEWIREHPVRGAQFIRRHYRFEGLLSSVVPLVVEQHHERSDGTGYPKGLKSEQIHDFARVLAIADSYEAMTSPRPFREAMHPAKAMRRLLLQGYRSPEGGMYDHRVLKTLVWSTSLYPVGCDVNLSDGRGARVVSATKDPRRPVVQLLEGGAPGPVVDLTAHRELTILN